MVYRRVGTDLLYNVTNSELLPLYEGNEAYELVKEEKKEEKAVEQPKKNPKIKK